MYGAQTTPPHLTSYLTTCKTTRTKKAFSEDCSADSRRNVKRCLQSAKAGDQSVAGSSDRSGEIAPQPSLQLKSSRPRLNCMLVEVAGRTNGHDNLCFWLRKPTLPVVRKGLFRKCSIVFFSIIDVPFIFISFESMLMPWRSSLRLVGLVNSSANPSTVL